MTELAYTLEATDADRLEQAEALVRSYCGWHIAPSRDDMYTVRTFGDAVILLPSMYVTAVATVTEADSPLTLDDQYRWLAPSSVIRRVYSWGCDNEVVVEFTHGYTTPPRDVTAVVQAVAQRAIDNPGARTSQSAGPFSESYSASAAASGTALALLESEKAALAPYKIPVLA